MMDQPSRDCYCGSMVQRLKPPSHNFPALQALKDLIPLLSRPVRPQERSRTHFILHPLLAKLRVSIKCRIRFRLQINRKARRTRNQSSQ